MLDENSLVVTYNAWRGEPRSRHRKRHAKEGDVKQGDCVDCNACVAVCPAGIDIRDGDQLECISCALCIDACNAVMDKAGLPRDLISYSTLKTYKAQAAGLPAKIGWRSVVRLRTLIYFGVWAAIGIAMLISLSLRDRLDVNILHDRNPVFVKLSDGSIRNGYTVKILNMEQQPRQFRVSLQGLAGATMTMTGVDTAPSREFTIDTEADKLRSIRVYVSSATDTLQGEATPFQFVIEEQSQREGAERFIHDATFNAPAKGK
jgi:cytochrome c oxidase accessory protein FixG